MNKRHGDQGCLQTDQWSCGVAYVAEGGPPSNLMFACLPVAEVNTSSSYPPIHFHFCRARPAFGIMGKNVGKIIYTRQISAVSAMYVKKYEKVHHAPAYSPTTKRNANCTNPSAVYLTMGHTRVDIKSYDMNNR